MLDQSIRKTFTMPASIEAQKTDMKTNQNGIDFIIVNKDGVVGEDDNSFKTDREWSNISDFEEGAPKVTTHTGVLNIVSLITTRENTSFKFRAEPRPGTPVVGDRTNVGEGQGKGFTGGKNISSNDFVNLRVIGSLTKDPFSFERDKPSKTEGNSLPP